MNLPNHQEILKLFASFLVESGLSAVSIKNYLSDARHFLRFLESKKLFNLENVFQNISKYINEYTQEQSASLTPQATINRRLASVRRISTFLNLKYQITSVSSPVSNNNAETSLTNNTDLSTKKILDQFKQQLVNEKKTNSTVKNYLSDLYHYFSWIANQTPFNTKHLEQVLSNEQLTGYISYLKLTHTSTSVISRRQSSIKKLTHFCFSKNLIPHDPFALITTESKLLPLAWLKRLIPKPKSPSNAPKNRLAIIYHKYNSLPFTPYFHLAVLVLATTTMAILAYNQVITQAKPSSAATSLTSPRRQLSFQGRLSDSAGTPINTAVNVEFKLWNNPSAGSQLYTTNTCSITPDADGVFNSLIGDGVCGTEISQSVFADNRDVYLEVKVGTETLTPRQQIATVGYALNSETLQGYPASASATINTVPVIDNSGNINIAVTSPSIISTSGNFNIKGQALSLTTATNSGGDIVLQPDSIGSGQILALGGTTTEDSFKITNANLTTGSLLAGYIGNDTATGSGKLLFLSSGATESARFWVLADGRTYIDTATASAITSAFSINQNGSGNLFTASASAVTKFNIANNGTINKIAGVSHSIGDTAGDLSLTSNSNSIILNDNVTFAGTTTLNGLAYTWPSTQTNNYVLQTNGSGTLSWVAQTGSGVVAYWDQQNGTLYPLNSTVDFLLGGQASSSAKFAILNINSGTPTASISGTSANRNTFFDGNGNLSTTNRQSLVLGNSATYDSTGNILLNPNGTGNVGIGTTNPLAKLAVWGGDGYIVDPTDLGTESLTNGNLTSGTSWTNTNDCALTSNAATCTFSAGTASTIQQASGTLAVAGVGSRWYKYVYTVSGVSGSPTASITTAFASTSTALTIATGTQTTYFQSAASPTNFIVSTTLTAGQAFTIDTLSLKEVKGGDLALAGIITGGGTTGIKILANGNVGIGITNPSSSLEINNHAGSNSDMLNLLELDNDTTTYAIKVTDENSLASNFYLRSQGLSSDLLSMYLNGSFGIGTTNPLAKLDVNGTASISGALTLYGTPTITTTANQALTLSAADTIVSGRTTLNTLSYTWPSTQTSNFVLQTNGTGTLSWVAQTPNYFGQTLGSLYPLNSTLDFFVGGQSTTSAKFAILNMNTGTPTASIAGNLIIGNGGYLGSQYGPLSLNYKSGANTWATAMTIQSTTGNVGIGDTSPVSPLTVGSGDKFQVDVNGNIIKLNNITSSFPSIQGSANSTLHNDGSGNLSWLDPTGTGVAAFWSRTASSLFPTNVTDTVAIGFSTAPDVNALLEVDGNIFPHTNITYDLGNSAHQWSGLFLRDSIFLGNTATITLTTAGNNHLLTNGQWNAENVFRVGDTTDGMPTGMEFYVHGDATVSGTIGALGNAYIGGNTTLTGTVNIGGSVSIGAGTGKLDVGTVDPPYTINGEKYATYLSGMIGVKEETTGNITTNEYVEGVGYRKNISFNNQEKGSDLWLFSKTTNLKQNLSRLSVLLTPKGQAKTWYEINENNNTLSIYASAPSEISYRLSAPRFDDVTWTNTRATGPSGFIIDDPDENNQNSENENINYSSQIANIDGTYKIFINDKEIKEEASFSKSLIANLAAGIATVKNLVADNIIINNKLISPIAIIDELNANNATISGNLYADNIKGKTIDKLNEQLELLNEKYSTASSILSSLQEQYSQYGIDPLQLSPLSTTSGTLPEDLNSTSQSIIAEDILANGSIFTKSLSSFDTDLFIQPTGDHSVHLLANLMTLYPNGQVVISGDLIVTGNLYANVIDTRTATISGTLAIGTSSIDASGSANFGQLTTNGLIIASNNNSDSSISGQTTSNSTIGTASIATNSAEITIINNKINSGTLIYITPISDTSNQVLYVKTKNSCELNIENCESSFTVAVPQPLQKEVSFNYWLVQTK